MATIKTTRTLLGTRYTVSLDGHKVKTHRTYEAAAWHTMAIDAQIATERTMAAITRRDNDAAWAGRC